jgi:hypothetical protein
MLIVPPRFDIQTFPFLIFDNQANSNMFAFDIAAVRQQECIESGYNGFKPLGVIGEEVEEENGKFKILGVSKEGVLRICNLEMY